MDRSLLAPIVVGVIEDTTGQRITPEHYDADLGRLGIDSVHAIDIANELEDILNIVIDDREIYRFRTVNAILDYFGAQSGDGQRL